MCWLTSLAWLVSLIFSLVVLSLDALLSSCRESILPALGDSQWATLYSLVRFLLQRTVSSVNIARVFLEFRAYQFAMPVLSHF